jgi:hypothetical protein
MAPFWGASSESPETFRRLFFYVNCWTARFEGILSNSWGIQHTDKCVMENLALNESRGFVFLTGLRYGCSPIPSWGPPFDKRGLAEPYEVERQGQPTKSARSRSYKSESLV